MTQPLSSQAEQARESARNSDGTFGIYQAGKSAAALSEHQQDAETSVADSGVNASSSLEKPPVTFMNPNKNSEWGRALQADPVGTEAMDLEEGLSAKPVDELTSEDAERAREMSEDLYRRARTVARSESRKAKVRVVQSVAAAMTFNISKAEEFEDREYKHFQKAERHRDGKDLISRYGDHLSDMADRIDALQ